LPGQKIKVGWVSDTAFGPVDPEITAAIKATAQLLKDLGCEVEEVRLPFMENTDWLTPYFNLIYGELGTLHGTIHQRPGSRPAFYR
jgi:aspartyl-tRNA(Asn)/glutamyl-tRNA(Gln) amidotransferase subunit A